MMTDREAHLPWLEWLKREWLLMLFVTLVVVLALIDPQPPEHYKSWLQIPTLAGLLGLLVAIQGIRDSGLVQQFAGVFIAHMHAVRGVGIALVSMTALLSMVLTNDVSLFLIVPLTVAIGAMSNLPVLRLVILEALAVNAGSTVSPIGNPQNLLLWQHARMPFVSFVTHMLPTAAVMFALVLILTWVWIPAGRVTLDQQKLNAQRVTRSLAWLSIIGLVVMIALMEYGHAVIGAALLFAVFVLFARQSLLRVDWLLLATFAAIFIGIGHLTSLPLVERALSSLDMRKPLVVYLSGIVASQLISNVPATVLLIDRVHDTIALAIAVNVGGFGIVIGSLANLIALRLAKQPHGLRLFHLVAIPFLLVCAPLVYAVMTWLG